MKACMLLSAKNKVAGLELTAKAITSIKYLNVKLHPKYSLIKLNIYYHYFDPIIQNKHDSQPEILYNKKTGQDKTIC